jgi:hypothetical protein
MLEICVNMPLKRRSAKGVAPEIVVEIDHRLRVGRASDPGIVDQYVHPAPQCHLGLAHQSPDRCAVGEVGLQVGINPIVTLEKQLLNMIGNLV